MSVMVIGIAITLLGAGTFSYFSDVETITGNTFTAGTLDISINPETGQEVTFENDVHLKPCEVGYIEFTITNDGNNPAVLWKHIEIIAEYGGLYPEPERKADPDNKVNDISNWILYDMTIIDTDGMEEHVIFYDADGLTLADIACMWVPIGILDPGKSITVIQSYHLKPETDNRYQGDWVKFDITIYAEQRLGNGPTQKSKKLFLDNKDGEPNWYFKADHIWGVFDWTDGLALADLFATGLLALTNYDLITYVDPWPGIVTVLASGTTLADGTLTINNFDITGSSPYTGKVWLVLKTDHDSSKMTGWNPSDYLFEANKATFPGP